MAKKYTADIIEATSITGSLLGTATLASALVPGNKTVEGDLTVTGKITAEEFHTEFVSSSIVYKSGSTKFGNSSDDIMSVTGSLQVQGSVTGSLLGTATNAVSASYAVTSSYALFAATPTVQGVQGTQGIQGLQGRQGTTGVGTQGSTGAQGAIGSQGTTGIQGSTGAQGTIGSQGTTGTSIQGTTGAQGTTGTSIQGSTGSQGTTGIQGSIGAQGTTGAQGTIGTQGVQGVQGLQGRQGTQGSTAGTATYVTVQDTRSTSSTPATNNSNEGVRFDFKANSTNGLSDGGTYNGTMYFRPYGSTSDWSGGGAHELGFTNSGDLHHRYGTTSWGSWQRFLDTANYNTYAPTLVGGGASGTWGISITGNSATSTILANVGATSTSTSTWNPMSLTYQAFGQRWIHSSISADSGDLVMWLRPSQYVGGGTEVSMMIDGDYYAGSGTNKVLHAGNYTSYTDPILYRGYSTSGDFQTLVSTSGTVRFDQVGVTGNWSNAPGGYTYGGVLSLRGANFGMQLWGSHTGDFYFKTQWNDDQYSGWRAVLHSSNYNSYAPSLTGGNASGTWGISVTGTAGGVAWGNVSSKPTTLSGYGITDSIKSNGTLSGNIDSDWGESFTTFDPIPSGTPPLQSPNIRTVNIGNSYSRRTQLAFDYASDLFYFRRRHDSSWGSWREVIHSGNYNSYAPTLTGTGASGNWGINVTGTAGGVAWGNVSSKPSYLMYYQGFTLDANTMETNATGFTYAVNAPYTGPIVKFSTGGGYDLQLNAPYGGNGYGLAFRTRNGDAGTNNSWQYPAVYGVNANGGGDLYATRYYDQNNTGYYLDPNSISYLSVLRISDASGGASLIVGTNDTSRVYSDDPRKQLAVNADYYPCIYVNALANNGNTTHGAVISMSGNLTGGGYRRWGMGIANTDPNIFSIGYYDNNTNPHYGVGGSGWSQFWIDTSGNTFSTASTRSPIFYDSNDTGYYLDPNSTGTSLRVAGEISLPGTLTFRNGGAGATYMQEGYGIRIYGTNIQPAQVPNASFCVGFGASGGGYGSGNGYFTGDVTAYYSDRRLKHNLTSIGNAVEKVKLLNGYTYQHNELGQELLDENPYKVHAGLIAQEVQAVLPEVVTIAPFDLDGLDEYGNGISRSGENYLTIKYERIVPLLIEAIKEQQTQIENQQSQIDELKSLVKQLLG